MRQEMYIKSQIVGLKVSFFPKPSDCLHHTQSIKDLVRKIAMPPNNEAPSSDSAESSVEKNSITAFKNGTFISDSGKLFKTDLWRSPNPDPRQAQGVH